MRENIEARLQCLRNVQILLDSAVVQMQQYATVADTLNRYGLRFIQYISDRIYCYLNYIVFVISFPNLVRLHRDHSRLNRPRHHHRQRQTQKPHLVQLRKMWALRETPAVLTNQCLHLLSLQDLAVVM